MSAKSNYPGLCWKCPKCEKKLAAWTDEEMQARGRRHQRNCKGKTEQAAQP